MNKKMRTIVLAAVVLIASLLVLPVQIAEALSTDLTKIGAQHFNSCYSKLPSSVKLSEVADFINYRRGDFSANGGSVPIPNTVMEGSADASPTITCQEYFFGGNDGWAALIDTASYNSSTDQDSQISMTESFLERLGYEPVVTKTKEEGFATITITYNNASNMNAESKALNDVISNTLNVQIFNEDGKNYITDIFTTGAVSDSSGVSIEVVGDEVRFIRGTDSVLDAVAISDDMTYEELVDAINQSIKGLPTDIQEYYKTNDSSISYSESDAPISNDTVFQRKSMTTAMGNLLGIKSDYGLTESEIFNIYTAYLSNGKYVEMSCGLTSDPGGDWMNVRLKRDGATDNTCYVRERQKTLYNGAPMSAGSTGYLFNQTNLTLADIVARINAINPENVEDAEDVDPNGGNGGMYKPTDDSEANEVNCFNAAGSLGWILCPVIEFTQNTITAIYGSIVENFLEFRAEWLDIGGQGESVYQAWQTFQSFANIIFVIVLLVVIFSQLTGVGIDNLGIKRVLPKLIIAAILINLSYLICMLFVDISNILGVGFNNIFSNIIVSIDGGSSAGTGAQVLTTVVTGAVAGAVGFLALNPVTVGIFGSVIVIPLVLGLIGVLVGVLFFFILLGARQAGIIMLVVASPIAFACYMLPNTKTIFDKWLKMFEGLLLLFPICGLLMGGSAFASKVLLTVDTGFLGALIAMLVGVVPFFFIPTLLRGAFSAMGNLGARISGIGQNISRGLGRAAAGSDTMKDFQTRMRAGIDRNGNLTRAGEARMRIARGEGRLGKVSALRQRVGRAQLRSLAAYEKMQDEVDLASRPDLYRADAEAKRFGRRQAAADSNLVSSGIANRTGDVKDFVAGQSTFEEGTLAYAAMQAARDGDVEMQYATTERMLAQGHHGAEAYRQVLATLEAQGDTAALENFAKAAKGSRNLGDLKSGARSTFDYVSAIADNKVTRSENGNLLSSVASGQSLNDYTNKVKYSNMSEAQVIGMDREELSRAAGIISGKRKLQSEIAAANAKLQRGEALNEQEQAVLSRQEEAKFTEQEQSLISQANKAFRNDRLRGSAKESNQKLAAEIAGISEAEQRRIVGDRIDINRNSENRNDGNGESTASNSTSNSGSNTSPTPNPTPSSSTTSTQAPASNSAPTPPPAPTLSPAPSRGNMTDEQLQNLRGFYQRKVNNNTATPEDRRTLNRINNELDLRETGYSRDEGTPV